MSGVKALESAGGVAGGVQQSERQVLMRMVAAREYDFPPEVVWEHATLWPNLALTSFDAVSYDGLPECRMQAGQEVVYRVAGGVPRQEFPWVVRLLEVDHDARVMRTDEHGGPIRLWRHTLTVERTGRGCRLVDDVSLDAGLLSPVAWMHARGLYRQRHVRRERLLEARD